MHIGRRFLITVLLIALPCAASADSDPGTPIVAVQRVELLGFPDDRTATGLATGLTRIVETRLEATGVETRAPGAAEADGAAALETTLTQIGTGYSIDLTLRDAAGATHWSGFGEADDLDQVRDKLTELVREAGENAPRTVSPAQAPPVILPPPTRAPPAAPAAPPPVTQVLDLANTPTPMGNVSVLAGQTWNFQAWYRDNNPGPTSNFTDAVSVTFL